MVDDYGSAGPGEVQGQGPETTTPDAGGERAIEQDRGQEQGGQPGRVDPKARPLTQEAFDRQYREKREAEERYDKAVRYAQELEMRQQELQQRMQMLEMMRGQSTPQMPTTADELEQLAKSDPQLYRELQLLDKRYKGIPDEVKQKLDKIDELERALRAQYEERAQQTAKVNDAQAINSIAATVHKEMGLTDPDETALLQAAVTPHLMNLMSNPSWRNTANQELKWDIFRRTYREAMEQTVQTFKAREAKWEKNYIEKLKQNRGGIPVTAGGAAPPAAEDDLERKYMKGEITEKQFLHAKAEKLGMSID